ncbi:MAG: outer membrane protein transport protein [Bacteroidetes bacterium]|nr:outer membrane protein transport protein [Bacteroidota bacterium]
MNSKIWVFALGAISVFGSNPSKAQNYFIEQALLFSRQNSGGSARIQGMGGAQVALGGDFSSALSNPAGLGMYNRNEFSITPAVSFNNALGNYTTYEVQQNNLVTNLSNSSASSTNLSLPGLSIVFGAGKNTDREPFYGGTFAITLNRVNDFNGSMQYNAQNNGSSIINYFLEVSEGYTKDQFDPKFDPNTNPIGKGDNVNTPAFLGYENYLFGPKTSTGTSYFSDLFGGTPFQKETINTSGSQNQWNLSYGANLLDKIFLGAGLGIMSVRYQYSKTYSEDFTGQTTGEFLNQCVGCFNNMRLNESRTTTGSGINLTLGALFKPIDMLQVGVSYVTGTSYQLNDTYSASMTTSWNNFDYFGNPARPLIPPNAPKPPPLNNVSSKTIDDPVNYSLTAPGRLTFGATVFIQKKGFITADVEMVNYNNASTSGFSEQLYSLSIDASQDVNRVVSSRFTSATNIRVGGEYRYKNFRFRAGYNAMGNPYANRPLNRINYSLTDLSSFSGGFGYRTTKFFADVAVVQSTGTGYYLPYAIGNFPSPHYDYDKSVTRIMFTVGVPF